MALDRAGKYPSCPMCLTTMELSTMISEDGAYLRCPNCYKSLIWKEEIRGRFYHEKGREAMSPFDCNWASGEIESCGECGHNVSVHDIDLDGFSECFAAGGCNCGSNWGRLVGLLIAGIFLTVTFSIVFKATHHCVRSHQKWVEDEMFEDVNHVWHTIPAHNETVCDQWERNP
jgi:hypothetical protein